jgi:hypothetical protein
VRLEPAEILPDVSEGIVEFLLDIRPGQGVRYDPSSPITEVAITWHLDQRGTYVGF